MLEQFEPTALRLDAYYVRYYNCYARILGTVVIPFVALAIFNVAIWRAVKRRRKDIGLGMMQAANQQGQQGGGGGDGKLCGLWILSLFCVALFSTLTLALGFAFCLTLLALLTCKKLLFVPQK